MSVLSEYKDQFTQTSQGLYAKVSHYESVELIDCIVVLYYKVGAFHGYSCRAHMNEHTLLNNVMIRMEAL